MDRPLKVRVLAIVFYSPCRRVRSIRPRYVSSPTFSARPPALTAAAGHTTESSPPSHAFNDKWEEDTIFLRHVLEKLLLQTLEGLLQRQQDIRHLVAMAAHDLVQHGVQTRQFETKGFVIAGLDVFDQRLQAGVGPGRLGRRWRGRAIPPGTSISWNPAS